MRCTFQGLPSLPSFRLILAALRRGREHGLHTGNTWFGSSLFPLARGINDAAVFALCYGLRTCLAPF